MVEYHQLTRDDRYQIEALLRSGLGIRKIARQLKREPSTISRELRKVRESKIYSADLADFRAFQTRRAPRCSQRKIQRGLQRYIRKKILEKWSPEQIAGRLRRESGAEIISYQTIYRYLNRDHSQGGDLWQNLRILRKSKDPKRSRTLKRRPFAISQRRMIDDRPAIVDKRKRLGDYERDTVLGKHNGSILLTLVDRTSRILKMKRLRDKQCDRIHNTTVQLLKNEPIKTITNDNGLEFARHRKTAKALKIKVYFAHPYHSWERGTNENTNGLLRQYFPRKTDLNRLPNSKVYQIVKQLNSRPRKCLGFQTPLEVHKLLKRQVLRL